MKKLYGNTHGLKASQIKKLDNLYRRKIRPQYLISTELARDMVQLSFEIGQQIGLIINRLGKITHVILGDQHKIIIPDTSEYRLAPDRLRGIRCIHTHLNEDTLSQDDLTDLALLQLDMMGVITMTMEGHPKMVHWAHMLPNENGHTPYQIAPPLTIHQLDVDCIGLIQALEGELGRLRSTLKSENYEERAFLISITTASRQQAKDSLTELRELARTGNIDVVDMIIQRRKKIDPRFLMGRGKLKELAISALQQGATLLIFDQELNPSQIRSITDQIELKVIDRTQLILDIFARRAQSREGKLQVELAQLKYLRPRLVTKNTAMSRLTGGIGGRGPGETKLEINRRRVRDRINRLEKALEQVQKQRKQQRRRRSRKSLPIISIIGYTNAGKSTLLNTLTQSNVLAESKLFATLDPSSRRLRFPQDMEVIITDTVGFIKNLPKDLIVAFRATLEELENADLLLHVIDISNPLHKEQIQAVEQILEDLKLTHIPVVLALNKIDLITVENSEMLCRSFNGIGISAKQKDTLLPLIETLARKIGSTTENAESTVDQAPYLSF
ncbi:MAG: GTPase HflX [Desulfobacteraceae bacterium]|jgi:GTP-binding protein HflX